MSSVLYPSTVLTNPNIKVFVPGSTTVAAPFSVATYCYFAFINPLPGNGANIGIDYVNPPQAQVGFTLPFIPGRMYNLASLFIGAANNSDGVEIIYFD